LHYKIPLEKYHHRICKHEFANMNLQTAISIIIWRFLLLINYLEEFVLWIHFPECVIQLEIHDDW